MVELAHPRLLAERQGVEAFDTAQATLLLFGLKVLEVLDAILYLLAARGREDGKRFLALVRRHFQELQEYLVAARLVFRLSFGILRLLLRRVLRARLRPRLCRPGSRSFFALRRGKARHRGGQAGCQKHRCCAHRFHPIPKSYILV